MCKKYGYNYDDGLPISNPPYEFDFEDEKDTSRNSRGLWSFVRIVRALRFICEACRLALSGSTACDVNFIFAMFLFLSY